MNLPWQIQAALACGYASYLIANVGVRGHHRTIDIVFTTLLFSLVATAVLSLTANRDIWTSIAAAFGVSCLTGGIWRMFARPALRFIYRKINLSWSDDTPSAWATLEGNSRFPVSQIAVLLDDGTWLSCDQTARFNNAPFGPCQLGPNGDVAFYLTHEEPAGGEEKELETVHDADYGVLITYVPAHRIRYLNIRHMLRS